MKLRKIAYVLICCSIITMFLGCTSPSSAYAQKSFYCMGKSVEIKIDPQYSNTKTVFNGCSKKLDQLEGALSSQNAGSDICKINEYETVALQSKYSVEIIELALKINELYPVFDITKAPLYDFWDKCQENGTVPNLEEVASIRNAVGSEKLSLVNKTISKKSPDVRIDLSEIIDGYIADVLVDYLKSYKVSYGMVSVGNCVAVWGELPLGAAFKIGVQDPADPSQMIGYIYLKEGAVFVANDYDEFYTIGGKKYSRYISLSNGYPVSSSVHSVIVVSDSGAVANALATSIFTMQGGFQDMYKNEDFEFECITIGDNGIKMSDGIVKNFEYIN